MYNIFFPKFCLLYLFLLLLCRDIFLKSFDVEESGLHGYLNKLSDMLLYFDPVLHRYLDEQGLDYSFFAVRWFTTLMTREFKYSPPPFCYSIALDATQSQCYKRRKERSWKILGNFSCYLFIYLNILKMNCLDCLWILHTLFNSHYDDLIIYLILFNIL